MTPSGDVAPSSGGAAQSSGDVAVIVVAAGSGSRLGADRPKAFVELDGRTILERAMSTVVAVQQLGCIVLVVPAHLVVDAERLIHTVIPRHLHALAVSGGPERPASVAAGLAALPQDTAVVLVHDAARPLTPVTQFDAVVAEVRRTGHGVIPGLPVADTIKRTDQQGVVLETVDRTPLAAVQTPQGFPADQLRAAYLHDDHDVTDDAALLAAIGHPVSVIAGDPLAFKITTIADLERARDIVRRQSRVVQRIGVGTDTHAFGAADTPLWLACLHWPGERGLAGHSDGDAVAHAITDALLSAAGLGDIGSRFGTSDPRFANARGEVFLTATREMLTTAGFEIDSVSAQIIGERPRFGARRDEAQLELSRILGAPVSLSATTTDGLGFTGRGEGVAVISNALVHATF